MERLLPLLVPMKPGKMVTVNTISALHYSQYGIFHFDSQDIQSILPYRIVELGLIQNPEG